jgi:DNA polymerase III subunit epsilon
MTDPNKPDLSLVSDSHHPLPVGPSGTPARFVTLDTETTGLDPDRHRILEVAAVEFDAASGQPQRTFHALINPQQPIASELTAIHGISDADVADAPVFVDVVGDLTAFVSDAHCVIHNANFDTRMLNAEFKRCKSGKFTAHVRSTIDTLAIARRILPGRRHTLDALCDHYKVDRSARVLHGATIDCALLAAVYPHLAAGLDRLTDTLSALLPFRLGSEVPEDVETAVLRWLAIDDLTGFLAAEQKHLANTVKTALNKVGAQGGLWEVVFSPRVDTDWKAITAEHLQGVDVAPYRKSSSVMNITWKKPEQGSDHHDQHQPGPDSLPQAEAA